MGWGPSSQSLAGWGLAVWGRVRGDETRERPLPARCRQDVAMIPPAAACAVPMKQRIQFQVMQQANGGPQQCKDCTVSANICLVGIPLP